MSEKKQLEFSAQSIANIVAIVGHIATDNPGAAKEVESTIFATAESLENFPMLGHVGKRAGTREPVIDRYPYFIAYRLTSKKVVVLAVMHQSRKYP